MSRTPPLNALRAFEAAGRHLNFRLAAQELGVTQGAVAQQVRGLEARIGQPLFNRLPRGLSLTDSGRRYLRPLSQAFRLIEEASETLSPEQRVLRISVPPSFASKWLVPRLGGFTQMYPHIKVQIEASERVSNFHSDGIDLAIRQGWPPKQANLKSDLLFQAEYVAVCSPEMLGDRMELDPVSAFFDHDLVDDTHGMWPAFLQQFGVETLPPNLNFSQTALAIDAAINGQGIALASYQLVQDDIGQGRLVMAVPHVMQGDFGFYIVSQRRPRHPGRTGIMRDWLLSLV